MPTEASAANPNVRTITAFIDLDPARYEQQITETAAALEQARAAFVEAGYPVQTLRVVTQPFTRYTAQLSEADAVALLTRIEEVARRRSVGLNIGPAVLDDRPDARVLRILGELQGRGIAASSSMIVASDAGIHWNTVTAASRHIKRISESSPRSQATFNFAAIAMLSPGSPFFPGSYHLNEGGRFAIGLESANVVADVLARPSRGQAAVAAELKAALSQHATAIHRVARQVEQQTGWKYWGLDPTPAPLKQVSIGAAMESMQGAPFGSSGTMIAAYTITQAVREVPGPLVGYAGLMLPVMEDARIAQRWNEGRVDLSSLLAYSAVCGTGLDAVPLPGDVSEDALARILGDVAVLAYKWRKPLTARLQPVHGRKAGETSNFDSPYLINAQLQPLQ